MRRDQLEHAIRASCQIIGQLEVIVVDLRPFSAPTRVRTSHGRNQFPWGRHPAITDDNNETMRLADLIFAVAGELSQFQQTHGFSIDGADLTTSALPEGWRTRLIKVQNENTAAPGGHPQFIGWCSIRKTSA
jgi:hypothetical protein